MAKEAEPFEINPLTQQAIDQARQMLDTYFDTLRKTVASSPSGGTEFGEKLKSYAEKNIAATHELVKQLSQARDFQDMVRIQTEFMQTQFNAFGEQAKNLSEACTKAMAGATKNASK